MEHKSKTISSIKDFMEKNWSTFTAKEVTEHVKINTNYSIKEYNLWKLIWIWISRDLSQGHKNMNLKKTSNIRFLFAMKYLKEESTETPMTNVEDPH